MTIAFDSKNRSSINIATVGSTTGMPPVLVAAENQSRKRLTIEIDYLESIDTGAGSPGFALFVIAGSAADCTAGNGAKLLATLLNDGGGNYFGGSSSEKLVIEHYKGAVYCLAQITTAGLSPIYLICCEESE